MNLEPTGTCTDEINLTKLNRHSDGLFFFVSFFTVFKLFKVELMAINLLTFLFKNV